MEVKSYKRYKNLKKALDGYLFKYRVSSLLATDLLLYALGRLRTGNLRYSISLLFKYFDYSIRWEHFRDNEYLLTVLWDRKDHRLFMESLLLELPKASIIENYELPQHRIFHPLVVLSVFFYVFSRKIDITFSDRLHFCGKLCLYLNTLLILEKQAKHKGLKVKKLIAFNGPHLMDAILTAFFKKQNVPTYSIQHGVYYTYKSFIPVDIINYEFQDTDYILGWGVNSRDVLQNYGIDDNKVIIFGNPKLMNSSIVKINKERFQNCLVMLGRFLYGEGNLKLIEILGEVMKSHKINFYVKFHPSIFLNNTPFKASDYFALLKKYEIQYYDQDNDPLLIDLLSSEKFDFTISYNTSSYLESYFLGKVSFRFGYLENDALEGLDDYFHNSDSFIELWNRFNKMEIDVLQPQVDVMLENYFLLKSNLKDQVAKHLL